jgi:hypothetical protein
MKNMEAPTVFLCQSTKLQQQKPTVDKKDGEDICDQGRFAQLEREVAELRQIVMASQNQVKRGSSPHDDNLVKLFAYI